MWSREHIWDIYLAPTADDGAQGWVEYYIHEYDWACAKMAKPWFFRIILHSCGSYILLFGHFNIYLTNFWKYFYVVFKKLFSKHFTTNFLKNFLQTQLFDKLLQALCWTQIQPLIFFSKIFYWFLLILSYWLQKDLAR